MSEVEDKLELFLRQASRTALDCLEASLSAGDVFRTSYETVGRGVKDYRYSVGMSELDIALLPRTVEQWVWKDRSGFIAEVITDCPDLGEGIELIMDLLRNAGSGRWDGQDDELSERLAQAAVDHLSVFALTLTERLLGSDKERYQAVTDLTVEEFLRDLTGGRPIWDVKAFLKCLWMEDEECFLADNIVLRRPRLDDYSGRSRVEGVSWEGLSPFEVERVGTYVGAVLEMSCGPCTEAQAREAVNNVIDSLLLFRVASLSREHVELTPRSVLAPAGTVMEDEGHAPLYHAMLRPEDHEDLRTFVRGIAPLVRDHAFHRSLLINRHQHRDHIARLRLRHSRRGSDRDEIPDLLTAEEVEEEEPMMDLEARAFHQYLTSLTDLSSVEERIARSIGGLESLYLIEDDGVDRKRAVALRASSLMEGWDYDALEVGRDIREGFRVRGELYGDGEVGERGRMELLAERLADYLRASLVIFFQARRDLSRKAFIEAIDLLVQGMELPEEVARELEGIFVNDSVPQPNR